MHLLPRDLHSLDDDGAAIDLGQTPARHRLSVFLGLGAACCSSRLHERTRGVPSLRCASLAQLKHPYSVDLYLDTVARHARLDRRASARRQGLLGLWRRAAARRSPARRGSRSRSCPATRSRTCALRAPRRSSADDAATASGAFSRTAGRTICAPFSATRRRSQGGPRDGARACPSPMPDVSKPPAAMQRRCAARDDHLLSLALSRRRCRADRRARRCAACSAASPSKRIYVASLKEPESEAFVAQGARRFRARCDPQRHRLLGAARRRRRARPRRRARAAGRAGDLRRARRGRLPRAAPMAPISR